MRCETRLSVLLSLLAASPALAQPVQHTAPARTAPAEPIEELVIEGQRPVLPSFQEEWEFQQMDAEFLALQLQQ